MIRRDDWEQQLQSVFLKWADVDYDQVTANCLLMIREGVIAMTGEDRLAALGHTVESVTTERGMRRFLAKYNGTAGALDAALGERIPAMQARRGDVAQVASDAEHGTFGIVDGFTVVCLEHTHGIAHAPLSKVIAAWSVG